MLLVAVLLLWPAATPPTPADATEPLTVAESTAAALDASAPVAAVPVQATQAPQAPADPTPDPKAVNLRKLHEAVFAPFRGVSGRFGIYVKDLGTGQTIALNEHFPFQSASLYKLPVMYEVFKLRDLDLFRLNEEMTIGPDDAEMDLGSLPWPIGTRITIGTALDRMVTLSDNSGAYMLAKKVGSPRINEDMSGLGLTHTHVRGDDLKTSAYDMARLLELIARGQALSPETSAEMVHLMARQQVRNRIPVRMPAEAVVANKTGNWESAAHDVAIVYGPRATFVIALLSDGIADFDELYDAMSSASRNVYDLVNDPTFETQPDPALPKNTVGNYITPVRLPNGGSASGSAAAPSSSTTSTTAAPRPPTSNVAPAAPAPTSPPADRPRAPAPTSAPAIALTPTPGSGPAIAPKPASKPAEKPAEKPSEKPQAPASTPAIKPIGPSIFVIATPTKTP
ncbi:MAG: serine hydrolase [Chloroflexi bacterium]|nr:serine hydrolase [Chloroflexota bacterium]